MENKDLSLQDFKPLSVLKGPISVFANDGQWHRFLPQMIQSYVILQETDTLAEIALVYQMYQNRPDQFAVIHVSGANGKLLAKQVREKGSPQVIDTPATDAATNPPGYGYRRFCGTDDREGDTDVFDRLIKAELATSQIDRMKDYINELCCQLNMRVTFEWVANSNFEDQPLVPALSYDWSKSTASPK